MTELTEPESAAAQPSPDWPGSGDAGVTDTVVAQALARLGTLPRIPVSDHENVYNELHDELLAALNTVPNNSAPTGAVPTNGPA
ncbi:hypothetical protein [Pseudarthrobacter quantipunctorum]|uniref:Uncharacterized protein n=1 Tax=Pseudarthrobacter quantipunctorum TaxID=3128980 RepID=A0ABZ2R0C1_9MICC